LPQYLTSQQMKAMLQHAKRKRRKAGSMKMANGEGG